VACLLGGVSCLLLLDVAKARVCTEESARRVLIYLVAIVADNMMI